MARIPDWANQIANALLISLRERDPYSYGHCLRVARHAKLLAKAAGLTEEDQRIMEYASLFHDLGKIGIPDRILLKPGRLTEKEEAIMREHPVRSVEIIVPLTQDPFFESLIPGVLHHHERIDGQGYPYQKKGSDIPLHARVMLIADTFDAMTTTRPYRKGLSTEIAFKELKLFAGRQFDAQLVKVFIDSYPHWGELEETITEEFVSEHYKRAA